MDVMINSERDLRLTTLRFTESQFSINKHQILVDLICQLDLAVLIGSILIKIDLIACKSYVELVLHLEVGLLS